MNELSHPLLSIIQRAAELKVEGPAALRAKRFTGATSEVVLVADVSGSMTDIIGRGGMTKEEHMRIAIADVLKYHPTIRIVAFADQVRTVKTAADMPDAGCALGNGTDLARALKLVARWKPRKTIVVSDGMPNNQEAALEAADKLTGSIDTIYCGPDDHPAVEFLAKLSRDTCGTSAVWDGYRGEISSAIRGLIG